MAYEHTNAKGVKYYLYTKEVTLRGSGKKQTIYFFSRTLNSDALDVIPENFQIVENKKTGLPVLKRNR